MSRNKWKGRQKGRGASRRARNEEKITIACVRRTRPLPRSDRTLLSPRSLHFFISSLRLDRVPSPRAEKYNVQTTYIQSSDKSLDSRREEDCRVVKRCFVDPSFPRDVCGGHFFYRVTTSKKYVITRHLDEERKEGGKFYALICCDADTRDFTT